MKLISFIGEERADFAYYVAVILKNTGKRVLVLDNSISGDLFTAVARNNPDAMMERTHSVQNLVFVRCAAYQAESFSKFDYVICYAGNSYIEDTICKSDLVCFMPDYRPVSLNRGRDLLCSLLEQAGMEAAEGKYFIIMRDLVSDKITDLAIAELMQTDTERIIGHIADDPGDYAKYITFLYNGRQTIKGLSSDYMGALNYVIGRITNENEKMIRKIMKKA